MYGVLVLCFGKNKDHVSPGATMVECIVLCLGYLSYVWDISLMSRILVVCLGYLSYVWDVCLMSGILVLRLGY